MFGSNQFSFIFDATKLNYNDKIKIEVKFNCSEHPISIIVNDNYDLIGG